MDWYKSNWFYNGIKSGFPLCCIMWFMNCWHDMPEEVASSWSSDRDGYIPCPKCMLDMLESHNPSS